MLPILTPLIPIPFNELNPQNTLTVCLSGCKYTPHFHSHNPFLNLFFTQIFNRLITNYLAVKKKLKIITEEGLISFALLLFSGFCEKLLIDFYIYFTIFFLIDSIEIKLNSRFFHL